MFKNRDFNILIGLSILIIGILALGYFTSPTFTQQQNFYNSIIYFLATLFVASVTLVVLWHGFKEFGVMLAIILAMIISLLGVKAGLIAVLLTYIVWGFAFSIELLLAHNGVSSAIGWFKRHYKPNSFKLEFKIFYPMIIVMHILLEIIPSIIYKEPILDFNPKELYEAMLNELSK
jgi:lysylphosphatidylglycerol synthetase-like protein (DUF2156 family)